MRPTDWAPLAEADPVPGDPVVVLAHARHLAEMADDIAAQVSRLQRIATADGLVGEFVEPLKQGASQLAERLGRVQGRYREVAAALGSYAPELETAQEESLRIRHRSQLAEADRVTYQRRLDAFPREYLGGSLQPMLAESGESAQCREPLERERDHAAAEVAQARAQLRGVEEARDRAAAAAARRIERGVDDSVVDSWWESVKEWVHHQAGWMKAAATALGYLGVALIVASLFLPGIGWLGTAALWAGWMSLGLHTPLALSGEGSWLDVGLDVVGLATLGAGKFLMPGLTRTARALRQVGALEKGMNAAAEVLSKDIVERRILRLLADASWPGARMVEEVMDTLWGRSVAEAKNAFLAARDGFMNSPVPSVAWHEVVALGGSEGKLALLAKDVQEIVKAFPSVPSMARLGADFNRLRLAAATSFGVSALTGVWGPLAELSGAAFWSGLGARWTREVGSSW